MRSITIIGLVFALGFSALKGNAQIREEFAGIAGGPSISKAIHIYPNPTNESSDYVNVRVAPFKAQNVKLNIHNIIGNEVTTEVEIVDEHELRIRVKDLSSGYYLLTIKDQETNFRGTYKILKR